MLLDKDDWALVMLSSSASLDRSPKKNWVENAGNLPPYIRKIARGVEKSGKTLSQSIAIAVSRVKKWAAGGDGVDADTKAKAAKAAAQWEALKAKNKAKQVVKATIPGTDDQPYLMLTSVGSFNTDMVRRAWDDMQTQIRKAHREARKAEGLDPYEEGPSEIPYTWIKELWSDFIIVEVDGLTRAMAKVPYSVQGNTISFGEPVEVQQQYVEVETPDIDEDLSDIEAALLGDVLVLTPGTPAARIAAAAKKLKA